jgi:hypothetical protein
LRFPLEQARFDVGGQRSEPEQVSFFDLRQRPIGILGHTAHTVTTGADPPDAATAIGRRHESACIHTMTK